MVGVLVMDRFSSSQKECRRGENTIILKYTLQNNSLQAEKSHKMENIAIQWSKTDFTRLWEHYLYLFLCR